MNGRAAPAIPDFGKSFTYVFRDPAWPARVAMGGLITLLAMLIVGIPILLGYLKKLFLAVVRDPDTQLPVFDIAADFREGLVPFGAVLVYACAVIVLALIPCIGICLALPVNFLVAFILPAALVNLFTRGDFAAAFDFAWIFAFIKSNLESYVVAFLITFLVGMLAALGLILCLVGFLFTAFLARLIDVHALAQVYTAHLARTAPATSDSGTPLTS